MIMSISQPTLNSFVNNGEAKRSKAVDIFRPWCKTIWFKSAMAFRNCNNFDKTRRLISDSFSNCLFFASICSFVNLTMPVPDTYIQEKIFLEH